MSFKYRVSYDEMMMNDEHDGSVDATKDMECNTIDSDVYMIYIF
jgi:hypothetical protein